MDLHLSLLDPHEALRALLQFTVSSLSRNPNLLFTLPFLIADVNVTPLHSYPTISSLLLAHLI